MSLKNEVRAEFLKLHREGVHTEDEIARILDMCRRAVQYWKADLKKNPHKWERFELCDGNTIDITDEPNTKKVTPRRSYQWSEITAADLVKAGFHPEVTPIFINGLIIAKQQNNNRIHRFLSNLIDISVRWPDMPDPWVSVTAGFPILAKDINATGLDKVATIVKDLHPYLGKQPRREYHRRVRGVLSTVLAETQNFLTASARAGGVGLMIMPQPSRKQKGGEKEDSQQCEPVYTTRDKKGRVTNQPFGDILGRGEWGILQRDTTPLVSEGKTSWSTILIDIVTRLPDPDRQKGKVFVGKRDTLFSLLYIWFSTAPTDFTPPLSEIKKYQIESRLLSVSSNPWGDALEGQK